MGTEDLERALSEARARTEGVSQALRSAGSGKTIEDWAAAYEEQLSAERALALAREEEAALPCEGLPRADAGAPLPHLLSGVNGVFVVYYVSEPDPRWDGTSVRVADSSSGDSPVAIVRFNRAMSVRMGTPNDEVLHGHPLSGRGLAAYRGHRVENSRWISELQRISSVHRQYDAARWTRRNHYLLAFHDEMLECVAEGFDVEIVHMPLAEACRRALEDAMRTE